MRNDLSRSPAQIGPSCGYDPLQSFEAGSTYRLIASAIPVRALYTPKNAAPAGLPSSQPSTKPKPDGVLSCGYAHFRASSAPPANAALS
jgi:hypothetical protein